MTGERPVSAILLAAVLVLPSCSSGRKSQASETEAPDLVQNVANTDDAKLDTAPFAGSDQLVADYSPTPEPTSPTPPADVSAKLDGDSGQRIPAAVNQSTMAMGNSSNSQVPVDLSLANVSSSMATAPDLPASKSAGSVQPFPREVTEYMVRRDGCDHFRGEDPYDSDRAAYIQSNIRALCTGSDKKLAELRTRYASNADVISALSVYDSHIEQPVTP